MRIIKFLLVTIVIVAFNSCGGGETENFFYSSMKNVSPTIVEGSSTASINALDSGTIIGSIYEALRDYEYPRDEGVIDMHNIYKVLNTAGQIYEKAELSCASITEKAFTAPYDMGLNSTTYNCAGNSDTMNDNYANGFAIKEVDGIKHGLLTYRWAPESTQAGHGILQGSYTATTGDVSVRMLHHTHYTTQDGFVVRSHIAGNETTHAFTLSLLSASTGTSPNWTSMVGKGISEGTGNYFLFRVKTSSDNTPKYFCFPASATSTVLEQMNSDNSAGKDTVDTECASYKTAVDAMTFLTTSDVPMSISDFRNSSILLDI